MAMMTGLRGTTPAVLAPGMGDGISTITISIGGKRRLVAPERWAIEMKVKGS
jgi:hypothetical protein